MTSMSEERFVRLMRLTRSSFIIFVAAVAVAVAGCGGDPEPSGKANSAGHSAPAASTGKANERVLGERPFDNRQDFADARRGLIAQASELAIGHPGGGDVWNMADYAFIDNEGDTC